MIETTALLRAYADLILRFSGAGSVSLVLTALRDDEPPTVVHVGDLPPVEELRHREGIRRLEAGFVEQCANCEREPSGPCPDPVDGIDPDCALVRIPVAPVGQIRRSTPSGRRRRSSDERPCSDLAVWLGLRYPPGAPGRDSANDLLRARFEAREGDSGDGWWGRILALAAALATHTHAVSRVLQDPLTGLPMRAGFRTELGLMLDRARVNRRPIALLLVNPDGYADVNRRYGRGAGDSALAEVAVRLRARVRTTDRVARYGGATFAIVLAEIAIEDAARLADKIRAELSDAPYGDGEIALQFSYGLVGIDPEELPEGEAGDPVAHWIRRADEALFRAKSEGGARGHVWSSEARDAAGRTVDRLQGMFTGDVNTDYRNMAMLWEVVRLIADGGGPEDMCAKVTARLHAWLPAKIIAIVSPDGGPDDPPRVLSALENGMPASDPGLSPGARVTIAQAFERGETLTAIDEAGAISSRAVPLIVDGRRAGCIYLEGEEERGRRDAPDPDFLTALASQLAIALDRARLDTLERARETERREILESEVEELRRVVGSTRLAYTSEAMRAVLDTARRIAPTDATVLITGESGTGKELLARTIHQLGDRRDRPLVVIDCGAIAPSLVDSELFGHEKGAFTGAHTRKVGRLAEADGATVFLDEIGELPLEAQTRLLRFVQEKQVTPVGGTRPRTIDVRILAATNVDLATRVRAGTFREDLFHRLNVVRLHVPPLRERKGDIVHLAAVFLDQYAALYRKPGLRLAPETQRELTRRSWTGNVRELQNRIMRAVLFADGDTIRPEDLDGDREHEHADASLASPEAAVEVGSCEVAGTPESDLRAAVEGEVERAAAAGPGGRPLGKWLEADLVLAADRLAGGVARRAAAVLGIADTTYRRRLDKARREHDSGLALRSETWGAVRSALDALLASGGGADGDLATRVEQIVLEAIVRRCGDDARLGARLLGVTEPTYLKRWNERSVGLVAT